jgi:uncharacterized protein
MRKLFHITPEENVAAILLGGFVDGNCPWVDASDAHGVFVIPCTGVWLSDWPVSDAIGPDISVRRKWNGPQGLFVLRVPAFKRLKQFEWPEDPYGFRQWCIPATVVNRFKIVDVRHVPGQPEAEEEQDFPLGFLALVLRRSNAAGSPVHGLDHWRHVAANGRALAAETPGCDPYLVSLFSLFHDCMREGDGNDPYHGFRAGQFVREVFTNVLPPPVLETLVFACEAHAEGSTCDDPTVGVCWDSDRLELPRVGVQPERSLLSTEAARRRFPRATATAASTSADGVDPKKVRGRLVVQPPP